MLSPAILGELRAAVDSDGRSGSTSQSGLITAPNQLQTYECDGLTAFRVTPVALRGSPETYNPLCRVVFSGSSLSISMHKLLREQGIGYGAAKRNGWEVADHGEGQLIAKATHDATFGSFQGIANKNMIVTK
jgi:hypothetical protein